jgi:hypothetical protein
MFDAERFTGRNLHVIDIVAIPDRLDDRIREAKGDDVLDRILSEVVIDPINLLFVQRLLERSAVKERTRPIISDETPTHPLTA